MYLSRAALEDVETLWVTMDGEIIPSAGMIPYLRDLGGAAND